MGSYSCCCRFWVGFIVGTVLTGAFVWTVSEIKKEKNSSRIPNTICHYEKIENCHYVFEVDTITNEVKRIRYFVPMGDLESWERKNSATGREE